jgi:hypothetical protein
MTKKFKLTKKQREILEAVYIKTPGYMTGNLLNYIPNEPGTIVTIESTNKITLGDIAALTFVFGKKNDEQLFLLMLFKTIFEEANKNPSSLFLKDVAKVVIKQIEITEKNKEKNL